MKARFVLIGLALAAMVTYFLVSWLGQEGAPEFRRPGVVSMAEMMAQPPTYAYGSSINVFVFLDDQDRTQELVITGHADSDTCRKASALIATALFNKPANPADFLMAGSARIVRNRDDNAARDDATDIKIRRFQRLRQMHAIAALLGDVSKESSSADGSPLAQMDSEMRELESDPAVRAFANGERSGEIVEGLLRDLRELSADTGLVEIHVSPSSLLAKVEERIRDAMVKAHPTVLSFADLLGEGAQREVAVVVPVYLISAGEPVVLRYDDDRLTSEAFVKAADATRTNVEQEMIGDVRSRLAHLTDRRAAASASLEQCKTLTQAQLDADISLTISCNIDGCFPADKPVSIKQRRYCSQVLPQTLRRWESAVKQTQALIERIEKDRKSGEGRIDAMTLGTLIDSMLRDWDLPVGRSQSAFDAWRKIERAPAWRSLDQALGKHGTSAKFLAGENTLFQVARDSQSVTVRPMHVLDLRRSALVVNPRSRITSVADAWQQRARVDVAPSTQAASGVLPDLAASTDPGPAAASLVASLAADPPAALAGVLKRYRSLFGTDRMRPVDRSAIEPAIEVNDFFENLNAINVEPTGTGEERRDQFFGALRDRDGLLAAFGKAPPEHELDFVLTVAYVVQSAIKEAATGAGTEQASWTIVGMLDDEKQSEEIAEALSVLNALNLDAKGIIKRGLARARATESTYVQQAFAQQRIPAQPSVTMATMQKLLDKGRTLEEQEVSFAIAAERLLQSRAHLRLAGDHILNEPARLAEAEKELESAAKASSIARIGQTLAARERLSQMRSAGTEPSLLARLETIGLLESSARLMRSKFQSSGGDQLEHIATSVDHSSLMSRLRFDEGHYSRAMDLLFPTKAPLAMARGDVAIETIGTDLYGPVESVRVAVISPGELVVRAQKSGQVVDFARIKGLPVDYAAALAEQLASTPPRYWTSDYAMVDQLRRLPVPMPGPQSQFIRAVNDKKVRMAMLKAMVYGCAAPRMDIAPLSGRCGSANKRRIDQVATIEMAGSEPAVPSLADVVVRATASLK